MSERNWETVTASAVGTAKFKKDGVFNGRVDKERVREFMEIVADIRKDCKENQ